MFASATPAVTLRGIHLDLKGLPPTPRRLLELLDVVAEARLNCVLVEWEDTYPWRRYPELRSPSAYSRAVVRTFLAGAAERSIRVIPLVQSFGHLENVLSRKRFVRLRERPDNVQELCPCHPRSAAVIRELIADVLETHEGHITHFHLGGDEVYEMGVCPRCRPIAEREGRAALYLRHMVPLLDDLKDKGLRPIIWDDMMRPWPLKALRKLAVKTDLMCWNYALDPFQHVKPETLSRFARAGITLWGASAFKGGDGPVTDLCRREIRVGNMLAWTRAARRFGLAGVVATGWSRASTFRVACAGLESSLDTLVLAGAAMWDGGLPKNYEAAARAFLNKGKKRTIAGEPFARCRRASERLAEWRAYFQDFLERTGAWAQFTSEPDRFDPRTARQFVAEWRHCVKEGQRRGREWIRAHRGLVPARELQNYVASRLWLARKLKNAHLLTPAPPPGA